MASPLDLPTPPSPAPVTDAFGNPVAMYGKPLTHPTMPLPFEELSQLLESSETLQQEEAPSDVREQFDYTRCTSDFISCHAPRLLPPHSKILVVSGSLNSDAVWLAAQGHEVTVMMEDEVALHKMERFVAESGFQVSCEHAELAHASFEHGTWDVIVFYHVGLEDGTRRQVHQRAARALVPGGVMMLEESWLHVELDPHASEIIEEEEFFEDFLEPERIGAGYTRQALLQDFGGTLENLRIEESKRPLYDGVIMGITESISVIGFS